MRRLDMSTHLTVLASLGVAILLSPEILVLGLVLASDRRTPRLAAAMYAAGAAAGLAMALAIGCLVAPEPAAAAAPAAPTWTAFALRLLIAAALLTVGIQRAIGAFRNAPVDGEAKVAPPGAVGRLSASVKARFTADVPAGRRALRAAALGFATMGLHPKCFSVAVAAGHQAMQLKGDTDRTWAIGLFAALAMLPALAPLAIETARPGGSGVLKDACEHFMRTKGRLIIAAVLVGAGTLVASHAFKAMPEAEIHRDR